MGWTELYSPLVALGLVIITATVGAGLVSDVPTSALAAQSTLPVAIGLVLIAYGWYRPGEWGTAESRWTVLRWTGYGVATFFVVGFWFGQIAERFETSFMLAIVVSLGSGAAVGALVGTYSVRLQRANAELERTNERLERVAEVISHDLRSPLTVAKGRLELAEGESDSEHLESVGRSLDRMEALVEDVLTLARERDRVDELEPVDLASVCLDTWENVETPNAGLAVDEELTVRADRSRLRQLLGNLFRNAVEHGSRNAPSHAHDNAVEHGSTSAPSHAQENAVEHGSAGPDVRTRLDDAVDGTTDDTDSADGVAGRADAELTVTVGASNEGFYVADDGSGLPEGSEEEIFESGVTTSASGTGLGLSIIREVARGHGWEVTAGESEHGGARFDVTGVERIDG
jgi:signal transduction histidine kinase